ncbi:hypothetical protein [Spirosoma gilvum]
MNRTQKIAVLTQALQGDLTKLQALKQEQNEAPIVFLVDGAPKGWFGNPDDERPVKTLYQLGDKDIFEYLTQAQMREKASGVIAILPNNQRNSRWQKMFDSMPPLNS